MTKRHPTSARRPGQNKPAESDDAFVAGVLEFSHWAKSNQKTLVIFAVAVVLVIVVALSYASQRGRQLEQAGLELERLQATMAIGDPDAAKVGLSQYLEQFGNTPYAGEAALLLGELYLESEQPDLALRALERAGIGVGDPLGAQALTLRARALEMSGSLQAAEETYLEIAEGASMSFERTLATADAARLREAQGNWAGAAELYREILAGLELSDEDRGLYEMRLAEAEARAR
ncbi:MAG TPA: tetratricopeptide repeat protein [Longimicrobiales bacterium]|nr:tetratricopeptide repeat protein [Longimicrobiales bacterium]